MPELTDMDAVAAAMIDAACYSTTLKELFLECFKAGEAIGIGRFAFTIQYSPEKKRLEGYITHWYHKNQWSLFEDVKAISPPGPPASVRDCINELKRYVDTFDVTRLGIDPEFLMKAKAKAKEPV
jgi:hypothetical protein